MPARTASRSKKSKQTGLKPAIFGGLNKKRIEKRMQGGGGKRVVLSKKDPSAILQFFARPTDRAGFIEYENHTWQDGGRWNYVPCAGDGCPLCEDEDSDVAKTSYRFVANVYNHSKKKVQVFEGGAELAAMIDRKHEAKPALFTKRCWEVTRFDGQRVHYTFERADADDHEAITLNGKKPFDLEDYLLDQMKEYYGEDLPDTSDIDDDDDEELDDDEDLEDEDEADDEDDDEDEDEDDDEEDEDEDEDEEETRVYTKAELAPLNIKSLREIAEEVDVDSDGLTKAKLINAILEAQEGEEDEDEEDEEEDEEDEEPPARGRRTAAKKAPPARAKGRR